MPRWEEFVSQRLQRNTFSFNQDKEIQDFKSCKFNDKTERKDGRMGSFKAARPSLG